MTLAGAHIYRKDPSKIYTHDPEGIVISIVNRNLNGDYSDANME